MADRWTGPDKTKHFLVCAGFSVAGSLVSWLAGCPAGLMWGIGFLVAVLAGIAKEWYDDVWSWKDIVADALGGVVGSTAVVVLAVACKAR